MKILWMSFAGLLLMTSSHATDEKNATESTLSSPLLTPACVYALSKHNYQEGDLENIYDPINREELAEQITYLRHMHEGKPERSQAYLKELFEVLSGLHTFLNRSDFNKAVDTAQSFFSALCSFVQREQTWIPPSKTEKEFTHDVSSHIEAILAALPKGFYTCTTPNPRSTHQSLILTSHLPLVTTWLKNQEKTVIFLEGECPTRHLKTNNQNIFGIFDDKQGMVVFAVGLNGTTPHLDSPTLAHLIKQSISSSKRVLLPALRFHNEGTFCPNNLHMSHSIDWQLQARKDSYDVPFLSDLSSYQQTHHIILPPFCFAVLAKISDTFLPILFGSKNSPTFF